MRPLSFLDQILNVAIALFRAKTRVGLDALPLRAINDWNSFQGE